jgi:indole-3-glycerol phosphate synthase
MILDDIAAATRNRIELKKTRMPLEQIERAAAGLGSRTAFPFEKALRTPGISFICEVKKASPSQGVISADYPYVKIAREYEAAGAHAISVLTEPQFFLGRDEHLAQVKDAVKVPVLRKDFIVDPYQIFEAKILGAAAVLLLAALLNFETIRQYLSICDELGMSAVVEAHREDEIDTALAANARVIGVNNRNLRDFTVDLDNSVRLRGLVPDKVLFIAESGIRTRADIEKLQEVNVNAVLIGETLMRSPDRAQLLNNLKGL